jgi:ribosome-associated protein YbcJ (S4-like RNA binding protein)
VNEPIGEQQQAELRDAAELYRPLARAALRAQNNGKWLAVFGGLSLAWGVLTVDWVALIVGGIVLVTGIVEMRQGRRLSAADADAPLRLCRNELVLGATISLYAILKLTIWRDTGAELQDALGAGNVEALGMDIEAMYDSMSKLIYATVLAVTVLYQGGMARYFLRQREAVDRYREDVADWAREIVQAMER